MKHVELAHVLRAAAGITNQKRFLVLGSKAVLGSISEDQATRLGEAFHLSIEADIVPLDRPDLTELIDGSIGEGSPFQAEFGYYADGVDVHVATLPEGWEARLVPFDAGNGVTGLCLEPHDLLASKLEAGRSKDESFILDVLGLGIVDQGTLDRRIALLPVTEERRQTLHERIEAFFAARDERADNEPSIRG